MAKRPSLQFYPGDWRRDVGVQGVSLAAQGLWFNMLCVMFECEKTGFLEVGGKPVSMERLSFIIGRSVEEITPLLGELEDAAVFSRTASGAIFSRRMVADERQRRFFTEAGKRGGNPKLQPKKGKPLEGG